MKTNHERKKPPPKDEGLDFLFRRTSYAEARTLLLVALSLEKLSLLVLSHLLAALLDHTTQRDSPCAAKASAAGPMFLGRR